MRARTGDARYFRPAVFLADDFFADAFFADDFLADDFFAAVERRERCWSPSLPRPAATFVRARFVTSRASERVTGSTTCTWPGSTGGG